MVKVLCKFHQYTERVNVQKPTLLTRWGISRWVDEKSKDVVFSPYIPRGVTIKKRDQYYIVSGAKPAVYELLIQDMVELITDPTLISKYRCDDLSGDPSLPIEATQNVIRDRSNPPELSGKRHDPWKGRRNYG